MSSNQTPAVGDEISYRSMEGCTVAVVEDVNGDGYVMSNGKIVPERAVLDVFPAESD